MQRKSDLEISPFNWECEVCGKRMSTVDAIYKENDILGYFDSYIDSSYLEKIPILKGNYQAQEILKSLFQGESTGLFCEVVGYCVNPECGIEYKLKLWIELELEKKDNNQLYFSVLNSILIDGNLIKVSSNPGFYRGLDIAAGLQNLYLRWWYLGGDIYIICPFIGKNELEYFDIIGRQILKTNSCITKKNNMIKKPFKKIITRKLTSYYEKGNDRTINRRASISELIKLYLSEINPEKIFLDREPGSGLLYILDGTLYEVVNIPMKGVEDHHKYANYFHGKMYGACFNDHAEIVITSYNYTVAETLQLESLAFVESTEENLKRQVEIFENDQYMTIKPVSISI